MSPRSSRDDAEEQLEIRHGLGGDPFGPLDSDDIDWLKEREADWEARQRRTCPHCGTVFHPVAPSADECPSLVKHEARCSDATEAEREFYAVHRRWPRTGQVDAAGEEAA